MGLDEGLGSVVYGFEPLPEEPVGSTKALWGRRDPWENDEGYIAWSSEEEEEEGDDEPEEESEGEDDDGVEYEEADAEVTAFLKAGVTEVMKGRPDEDEMDTGKGKGRATDVEEASGQREAGDATDVAMQDDAGEA